MTELRNALVRIAKEHPETRKHLLPLLKQAAPSAVTQKLIRQSAINKMHSSKFVEAWKDLAGYAEIAADSLADGWDLNDDEEETQHMKSQALSAVKEAEAFLAALSQTIELMKMVYRK